MGINHKDVYCLIGKQQIPGKELNLTSIVSIQEHILQYITTRDQPCPNCELKRLGLITPKSHRNIKISLIRENPNGQLRGYQLSESIEGQSRQVFGKRPGLGTLYVADCSSDADVAPSSESYIQNFQQE